MGVLDGEFVIRHRLSVDDYHKMGEAGVFAPNARVELIGGEVLEMAPIGTRHASTVKRIAELLYASVGERATVSVQDPIRLGEHDEPEPDLALLTRRSDFYRTDPPTAADTLLIIEVAESSARYDREIKVPLYARHGIPEVWLVDLESNCVRFFRQPRGDAYADITATETPGPTPVAALPGVAIDLAGVL